MPDLIADILAHADALRDPHHHAEPRWEWDHNRHKKPLPPHVTIVSGLIQQLRDMAEPGNDGGQGGTGSHESCPVAIDAVSLLASITHGTAYRAGSLGVPIRDTPEANIGAILGCVGGIDQETQRQIRNELGAWRNQAEIITGWKLPALELRAPCPALIVDHNGNQHECGARGTLLAAPDGSAAWCTSCRTRWDAGTVGLLAEHVRTYREDAEKTAKESRARAVEERRRAEGRHATVGT